MSSVKDNVLGALARQTDGDDSPEAQGFLDHSRDIRDLLLDQAFIPRIAVRVNLHDLLVGLLLNALSIFRSKVGDAHNQIPRNRIQSRRNHSQTNRLDFVIVELGLWVLENIPRNARLISPLCNAVFQNIQQISQILIPPQAKLISLAIRLRQNPQQRDVVLPVVTGTPKIRNTPFNIHDLLEQFIRDIARDPEPIVQRETRVQRKPLEVFRRVDVYRPVLGIMQQLADALSRLEVDNGHVGLHGGAVQGCRGGFATALARLVPGGGTDGKALGAGYDAVEGVEGWARDEGGLVFDPELADGVEGVGEDDALFC